MSWTRGTGIKTADPAEDLALPTHKEALILEMLIRNGGSRLFGLEMVATSQGKLRRGTIYVTLQRMKEKGFIDSQPEPRAAPEIGIPRRLYWATGIGERAFAAYEAAFAILTTQIAIA